MPIYTCAELKGRIKVGNKVKSAEGEYGSCYHLTDGKTGTITKVNEVCFWINTCSHAYSEPFPLELLDEEKTLDTVDVGDVVFDEDGREIKIMDYYLGKTVLFVCYERDDEVFSWTMTREQMKRRGYTIKQPKPVRKMTHAEVEKLVGEPIEIVEE